MKKKVLFITTHNLATNPRLLKEVELALRSDYHIQIICFEFYNWSYDLNQKLKKKLAGVQLIIIPAGRRPFLPWLQSVIAEGCFRFLGRFFRLPLPLLSQAVSRRSTLLIKASKKVVKADLVVGHNPGALWPALQAAGRFDCAAGFDMEDYHPGEGNHKHLQNLTKKLIAEVLPKMSYVSFAAPLILEEVKKDIYATEKNWLTVLNYFPESDFITPSHLKNGPVKMIWFSQNINAGRGLELILPYVKNTEGNLELHLFGNLNEDFYKNYLKNISNITVHEPLQQKELHHALEQYDIGLALEPAKDRNNELALSNKMLAYLQAGLFVVATNTPAQQSFLQTIPAHGLCFDHKMNNVEEVLEKVIIEIDAIRNGKNRRFEYFKNRNWETASAALLNVWNNV